MSYRNAERSADYNEQHDRDDHPDDPAKRFRDVWRAGELGHEPHDESDDNREDEKRDDPRKDAALSYVNDWAEFGEKRAHGCTLVASALTGNAEVCGTGCC